MTDQRLYILMRNDLASMGPGRACAMASHATNAFMKDIGNNEGVKAWQKETKQGFGTTIILGVNNAQLTDTMFRLKRSRFFCDKVTDPDYCITVSGEVFDLMDRKKVSLVRCLDNFDVVISRAEVTCAWVFGEIEALKPYLGDLPLYS